MYLVLTGFTNLTLMRFHSCAETENHQVHVVSKNLEKWMLKGREVELGITVDAKGKITQTSVHIHLI